LGIVTRSELFWAQERLRDVIPYAQLDTVFLDAGNTLISMNFDWVAQEFRRAGLACEAEDVRRAEAVARPATSLHAVSETADGLELFRAYIGRIAAGVAAAAPLGAERIAALSATVTARLKQPGCDYRLWSWVMPGVPEALATLSGLGLQLAVVSNSDGSVERALRDCGLRDHLGVVVDSDVVGFEKPDPRIFAHALEWLGADARSTVHVGDMYFQDVEGARGAGLHAVLLDPYAVWDGRDCDRCADLGEFARHMSAARG
jgi:HAD superfamily hydrolase (TIGR01509 family)